MCVVVCVSGQFAEDALPIAPGFDSAFNLLNMSNMSSISLFLAKQSQAETLPMSTSRVGQLPPAPPPGQLWEQQEEENHHHHRHCRRSPLRRVCRYGKTPWRHRRWAPRGSSSSSRGHRCFSSTF